MVTVQSDLRKSNGWYPAVYLPVPEQCLDGAFEDKAPVSEAMEPKRDLDLGLGMAETPVYCSEFSHLNFEKERKAGLQENTVACLFLSKPGQFAFSTPCLSQGEGRHSRRTWERQDETKDSLSQNKMVSYVQ